MRRIEESPATPEVIELRQQLLDFVAVTDSRAPLYARLAVGIAEADEVLTILAAAPQTKRLPVTLFAAIHDVLLANPDEPLADWYPNLSSSRRSDDPVPALLELCSRRRAELIELVRTRTPQTNEIGRSSLLLVGLSLLAAEVGPLAHLDVGASAGLNLLVDRFRYDYDGHHVGAGQIELRCGIRGESRPELLPSALPVITSRLGLDLNPVEVSDPEQVRWLEACVWPDQPDRFERLRLALAEAAKHKARLLAGDAIDDLEAAVAELGPGHPVVTTSWVLNYLGEEGQRRFMKAMDALGRHRELSLVCYEAPNLTPGLDWPTEVAETDLSVLRLFSWRDGRRTDEVIAKGHPHGYWLTWLR
ncbi:DUF2332 domain-containing protein [Propionicimonas sp.]|uniref:DUF2332 domain-containing protein n=1 Tax=Propionicimonas sp. TaxID=1955623 RepID=UPI0025DE2921|nr:DUF2332 domain-containing protein [Propionicimonas sp.]MBU3977217.1 DUF2332 domain-containing protein [Actinomycetota bacterium]MBU3985727.1 DUF2332 domain-containing protein [Actinomycetota bacterium]MBU4008512.1 DUF2332 domain-containing protein [Actinomycetota bacterium]MBU4066338.1 DUF2332 domain-containing protein [Actinomycetota bacterium]MBU4093786.1 DUF2332 domain-containing protein [Actinomycetota bacterium]